MYELYKYQVVAVVNFTSRMLYGPPWVFWAILGLLLTQP